jgi:release factor glutamine methyltransferase
MTTCPSNAGEFTVGRLLEAGAVYLCRHGIEADEAQNLAEILLSEALQFTTPRLQIERNREVEAPLVAQLREQFRRLASGEPIQYILGQWPFHEIMLRTDARALIPRPETEVLVERVLKSEVWSHATRIADIGTGTGAIILSLANAARGTDKRFTAVDLSPDALSLARENAQALGLEDVVTFVEGNGASVLEPGAYDIIVSNPPYIASRVVDGLPKLILDHEPRLALDGGEDGLDILRQIVLDGTQALRSKGRIFFEMGDEQGLAMQRILERAGYSDVVIAKDYAGHDRYAEGSLL